MQDNLPKVARGECRLWWRRCLFSRLRNIAHDYSPSEQFDPSNASAWIKFTELESVVGEYDRVRAIYELAVDQPSMDMPELIWKSWIDFEYDEEEYDRARELYERLLRRTSHVKVWVSFAQFEANVGLAEAAALSGENDDDDEDDNEGAAQPKAPVEVDQAAVEAAQQQGLERARKVFERGYADLKKKSLKEEVSTELAFPPPPLLSSRKCR